MSTFYRWPESFELWSLSTDYSNFLFLRHNFNIANHSTRAIFHNKTHNIRDLLDGIAENTLAKSVHVIFFAARSAQSIQRLCRN